jgi:hypothetical protein
MQNTAHPAPMLNPIPSLPFPSQHPPDSVLYCPTRHGHVRLELEGGFVARPDELELLELELGLRKRAVRET